jgi:phosphoacetylglucosamine mutase
MTRVNVNINRYKKDDGYLPSYGTAGFRDASDKLDSTVYRCGVLMSIRSHITGKSSGVMISGSHNICTENGLKLIDHTGEMIDPTWEQYATELVQAESQRQFDEIVDKIYREEKFDKKKQFSQIPSVVCGIDTRESGHRLKEICHNGIESSNAIFIDAGTVTTPELHFIVDRLNQELYQNCSIKQIRCMYLNTFITGFKNLCRYDVNQPMRKLYVDCADGVGAHALAFIKYDLEPMRLQLELINVGKGVLNEDCGADYVQKNNCLPKNFENVPSGALCCSLDGDADRVVFFKVTKQGCTIKLLDGDRLSILFAEYLKNLLTSDVKLGVVQTAYANNASTKYLEHNNIVHSCVPTGVKHLHAEAKKYDVAVYFESNGHGTILINDTVYQYTDALLDIKELMNQNIGDGISAIIMTTCIIGNNDDLDRWISMYNETPCLQKAVSVKDKKKLKTKDADRVIQHPTSLKQSVDEIIQRYEKDYSDVRAFVRASGTEDKVRIYAEHCDVAQLNKMVNDIEMVLQIHV